MEVKDKDLAIQVIKIENQQNDRQDLSYAVRLTPDKHILLPGDNKMTTALWYHMDSCFYLSQGKKKIYPAIIQPIANGIGGTFEYYVAFDESIKENKPLRLVYQDKYLNKKKYEIIITD